MKAIEDAAFISVGRASGFAGLAILCVMLGLSFDPVLAARAGGVLGLGLAAILGAFGGFAPRRAYKHTETWLILRKADRPSPAIAQRVIGQTLRDTYLWFAERVLLGSMVMLGASLLFKLMGWTGWTPS